MKIEKARTTSKQERGGTGERGGKEAHAPRAASRETPQRAPGTGRFPGPQSLLLLEAQRAR